MRLAEIEDLARPLGLRAYRSGREVVVTRDDASTVAEADPLWRNVALAPCGRPWGAEFTFRSLGDAAGWLMTLTPDELRERVLHENGLLS